MGFTSFGVAFSLTFQTGLPHVVQQPCPVNNETAMRFVDKKRYVLPYALPSKVGSAPLCRTTFMVQSAYSWGTTSLIHFC